MHRHSAYRLAVSTACLSAGMLAAGTATFAQAPFTEEAIARGINYVADGTLTFGDGIAFFDLDNDGDADAVCIGAANGRIAIFENNGSGQFTDRIVGSGITPMVNASGLSAGDYDRDGDLDIYISGWAVNNRLYRNDGNFQFTEVALAAGVRDSASNIGSGCGWGDYNNDGWLDLYLANRVGPNALYRNNGNGTFTNVIAALGVQPAAPATFQASFFDIDRDGDSDLYLITDKGTECGTVPTRRNYLYENLGGTFVEITTAANAQACADAMSIAVGDFDGNLFQDIYITNTPPGNVLLMNQGDKTFLEQQVATGTASYATGWGAEFFDFDNDGYLDLYVCNQDTSNRLYSHGGAATCTDLAAALNCNDASASFAVASADVDNDGDLDLLVQNRNAPVRLYINQEGTNRRWAKFDVFGEGPNRYAVGARIDVRTASTWRTREVIAGHNYKSQNHLVSHFGLAAATVMDEIIVTWPGAATTRTLAGYPTNHTWMLIPPDKLGDADQDGQRLVNDFGAFVDCYTGAVTGAVSPGCEMFDFDGDSDVDTDDYLSFKNAFDGDVNADCNSNGTPDMDDIMQGNSADANRDGIPDECVKLADLDGDGIVNVFDLLDLLAAWGACSGACPPSCTPDISGAAGHPDCAVDVFDLLTLLSNWG